MRGKKRIDNKKFWMFIFGIMITGLGAYFIGIGVDIIEASGAFLNPDDLYSDDRALVNSTVALAFSTLALFGFMVYAGLRVMIRGVRIILDNRGF